MTFQSLTAEFKGDNSTYRVSLGPEGWDCSCTGFRTHGMCPHVMTMERLFKPMIKRAPLPYAPGQNVVSDVEKSVRYSEEPDRIHFVTFDVSFQGDNDTHNTMLQSDAWHCDCSFFASRGVCCHTMALERSLKGMVDVPSLVVE